MQGMSQNVDEIEDQALISRIGTLESYKSQFEYGYDRDNVLNIMRNLKPFSRGRLLDQQALTGFFHRPVVLHIGSDSVEPEKAPLSRAKIFTFAIPCNPLCRTCGGGNE